MEMPSATRTSFPLARTLSEPRGVSLRKGTVNPLRMVRCRTLGNCKPLRLVFGRKADAADEVAEAWVGAQGSK